METTTPNQGSPPTSSKTQWCKPKMINGVRTFWTVVKENTYFQLIKRRLIIEGIFHFNKEPSFEWKIVIKVSNLCFFWL